MIGIICGGRDFIGTQKDTHALNKIHAEYKFTQVFHGAYRGADDFGKEWSKSRGIPDRPFPADWNKFGLGAGPRRNSEMVECAIESGDKIVLVAFPGNKGTTDIIMKASSKGIPVILIDHNGGISYPMEFRTETLL
jgi:hypothetical protein